MADLNLKAGTNMSIRQEDTDLYLDNTYEYDDTQIQQDLLTRSLITETGKTIELTLNNTNYKMTAILKNKYGTVISTSNEIDLPIESLVVSIYYDSTTKELVFVLKDGTTTRVPLLDLIDGLATEEDLQTFEDDINEDMETFKGDVEQELEKAQQDLSMYKMLENALPKVEGEGETIHLDNTAKCPMKLGFKGQIQQVSTTGKNIIDLTQLFQKNSGAASSNMLANSITINGTSAWGSAYFYFENTSKNTNYTASCKAISSLARKGGITIGGANDTSGTGVTIINSVQGDISANVSKKYVNSFNSGDYEYIVLRLWNNATATALGRNVELNISEIQLELGSTPTDYEPYTGGSPSPSPSYPQDIHIVSGDNEIKVCGKNLFDKNSVVGGFVNADGSIGGDTNAYRTSDFIPIQPNTTYYKTSTESPRTKYYDINKQPLNTTTYQDISIGGNAGTFTTPNNVSYLRFSFPFTGSGAIDASTIMVKEGTDTTYEPYQGNTYNIDLPVENLFDKDNATYKNGYFINSSGVEHTTGQSGYTTSYVKVRPNTTYTLSGKIKPIELISGVYFYDNTKNWISRTNWAANTTENYFTFITPSNCYYIQFQYNIGEYNANTIQICEGNTKTYYPYGTTPIEVGSKGEYEDEFFKNTIDSEYYDSTLELDKWYLKKRIGKYIFDGTENIRQNQGAYTLFVTKTILPNSNLSAGYTNLYSNRFIFSSTNVNSDGKQGQIYIGNNDLNINYDNGVTDPTGFETWLTNNQTIIVYPLATPTNTLLNDTLQETLDSFYSMQEQTSISQENNDLPFVIKASAIYDLNDLITRVATLETE